MQHLCEREGHSRAGASIRPYGKTWRSECRHCGVPLIRLAPKQWREMDAPSAAPATLVAQVAPAESINDLALKLTAVICKIELEAQGSREIDRRRVIDTYFECLRAIERRGGTDAPVMGLIESRIEVAA